jgi:hypothetical protein
MPAKPSFLLEELMNSLAKYPFYFFYNCVLLKNAFNTIQKSTESHGK